MIDPRPTLQDVAARAKVSTATVSRCLSAPDQVRAGLRQRVQTAISELGYTPHGAARALASQRSNTIGAIVPTLDNAIFATFIETLQHELSLSGRTLLLAGSGYDPVRERAQIEALIVRGVDGLMLTGEMRDAAAYALLTRRGVRYVNAYVHHPQSPHPTIGFDNCRAMEMAVNYLHDLGHRKIAMIGGLTETNDRAAERIAGVKAAALAKGLRLAPAYLVERPYELSAGRNALRQLMVLPEPPTAVLCGNDILAIGALLEAGVIGLGVPSDVSIIGFDDLDLAKEIPPGLTTVHAPFEEMGRLTAAYLLENDLDDGRIPHIELPTDLVVRGSTGPVA